MISRKYYNSCLNRDESFSAVVRAATEEETEQEHFHQLKGGSNLKGSQRVGCTSTRGR